MIHVHRLVWNWYTTRKRSLAVFRLMFFYLFCPRHSRFTVLW